MSQKQSQGLGGLSYKSTNDLSGTASDVTNGNANGGTTYKNAIGMALVADTANACSVVLAGANVKILGVCANNPKAGEPAQLDSVRGTSTKVLVGAAVAKGDKLMTDSNGRFITAASTAQHICGVAMEAASAAGQMVEAVLLDDYVA